MEDLLRELLAVDRKLQAWHSDFNDPSQESMPFGEQPTTWENYRLDPDELSEGKLFPLSYNFTRFPIAMAFVYFEGIRIQLLKTSTRCAQYYPDEVRYSRIHRATQARMLQRSLYYGDQMLPLLRHESYNAPITSWKATRSWLAQRALCSPFTSHSARFAGSASLAREVNIEEN